jgi:hypothetical protein
MLIESNAVWISKDEAYSEFPVKIVPNPNVGHQIDAQVLHLLFEYLIV